MCARWIFNVIEDYAVSTLRLNCRAGAGTDYGVVQELPLGTRISSDGSERVRYSTDGKPDVLSSANFKFLVPLIPSTL